METKFQPLRTDPSEVDTTLPPKTEEVLYAELVDSQIELYKELASEKLSSEDEKMYLTKFQQLRKVCDHVLLLEGHKESQYADQEKRLIQNSGKMIVLDKVLAKLEKEKHQVLIFSQVAKMLDILEEYCLFRQYKYCKITGNTKPSDRQKQINEFIATDSDKFIFIISTKGAGLGINLNTADIVILYDCDYNKFGEKQAIEMAHRNGQKKPVNVIRLTTKNTMEEKINEICEMPKYECNDEKLSLLKDCIEFGSYVRGGSSGESKHPEE